ncbi:Protein GrpE [Camellia lanceoleosa]|uniref:Protein GrpE n=2 Tax=Camellia lanceoleosa TaxID=1840588 RepID=A0ACC0FRE8_9ERIC|nr:Protein GrpE [Camellia lanceoleosa]KAI7991203.1 Protein GrpE [Camellia lanceoleosa]
MATAYLRTPTFQAPLSSRLDTTNSSKSPKHLTWVSLRQSHTFPNRCRIHYSSNSSSKLSRRRLKFFPFASYGETTETDEKEEVQESQIQDNIDGAVDEEDGGSEGDSGDAEEPISAIIVSLNSYKEALASNDESKVAEIEAFLKSIEDEKIDLERKVATLSEELSNEKARILRISADFDNFRKRTDKERLSLVTNAQGEVVENLLSVLDNFERAKAQLKIETEGEEKINNSYQSIYKQFVEILGSLGVVPVEAIGNPFDPLLHEAIMREESTEFEEDIIIEEYRKGFKLRERLLRPSMVKVSAGPGPAKAESTEPSEVVAESASETKLGDEGSTEAESPGDQ